MISKTLTLKLEEDGKEGVEVQESLKSPVTRIIKRPNIYSIHQDPDFRSTNFCSMRPQTAAD
jgi:hypothetical protein